MLCGRPCAKIPQVCRSRVLPEGVFSALSERECPDPKERKQHWKGREERNEGGGTNPEQKKGTHIVIQGGAEVAVPTDDTVPLKMGKHKGDRWMSTISSATDKAHQNIEDAIDTSRLTHFPSVKVM